MITHVLVELKHPVKEEYFPMDTVLPSQYYGYGTPVIMCKDCKWFSAIGYCDLLRFRIVDSYKYCAWAERFDK